MAKIKVDPHAQQLRNIQRDYYKQETITHTKQETKMKFNLKEMVMKYKWWIIAAVLIIGWARGCGYELGLQEAAETTAGL
jgi:hypothetical protein